jgi:hypothetical protein
MTGKMQARILDRGLHSLTAFLYGGVGQTNDDDCWQAVGVIYFDLNDNTLQSDDSAGIDTGKHCGSLDEEGRKVNRSIARDIRSIQMPVICLVERMCSL